MSPPQAVGMRGAASFGRVRPSAGDRHLVMNVLNQLVASSFCQGVATDERLFLLSDYLSLFLAHQLAERVDLGIECQMLSAYASLAAAAGAFTVDVALQPQPGVKVRPHAVCDLAAMVLEKSAPRAASRWRLHLSASCASQGAQMLFDVSCLQGAHIDVSAIRASLEPLGADDKDVRSHRWQGVVLREISASHLQFAWECTA